MKISVLVKTKSKTVQVEKIDDKYIVCVKQLPDKGEANKAVIKALAKYLRVTQDQIEIKKGHKSKNKIIEVKK